MPLLQLKDLDVRFDTPEGEIHAVNGLSLSVEAGDALAIVGESGCGKTQTMLAVMGLLAENGRASGEVLFAGKNLLQLPSRELNRYRGTEIAMIFQDAMTSLNPYLRVEKQMVEVLMHHRGLDRAAARRRAIEMLRAVRIPDPERRIRQYPHEYSGGMRQRVMVAMGLLGRPQVLIADEPTTALDVTVQAQINQLMRELRAASNTAIVLITHDLGVVAGLCEKVMVMYAGEVIESGSVEAIYYRPRHPYTRALLRSVPRLDQPQGADLLAIPGAPPNLLSPPGGCRFRPRCPRAFGACTQTPPLRRDGEDHSWRCFLEEAP